MVADSAHILRRSVEIGHSVLKSSDPHGDGSPWSKLSPWAVGLISLTVLAFYFLIFASWYSYLCVVGVLTTVESPQLNAYVPVDNRAWPVDRKVATDSDGSDPLLEPEILLVKNTTAITSTIRRTIRHLRSKYGYLSRFRGFSLFFCLAAAHTFLAQALCLLPSMGNFAGAVVASIAADLLLARWTATWVHIVISEPTDQPWWRRMLPMKTWTKIAPAVAIFSIVKHVTAFLPVIALVAFNVSKNSRLELTADDLKRNLPEFTAIAVLSMATSVLLRLPATVVLVRVAASMLPNEAETVVPFDRSFGGQVTRSVLGEQARVGILDAWTSFDRSARFRLLKLIVKVVAIMVTLCLSLLFAVSGELYLFGGSEMLHHVRRNISNNAS